jgi:hypothetical protein
MIAHTTPTTALDMLFSAASSAYSSTAQLWASKQTAIRPSPSPSPAKPMVLILQETGLMLIDVRGLSPTACLEHASMPVSTLQKGAWLGTCATPQGT